MAEMMEQTTTGTTKTKWWSGVLTTQTVLWLFAAFVWMVLFWKDSRDNWDKTKQLEVKVNEKSDDADLKSLAERVNRQYETSNKILERIIILEKQQEYEKGYHKALEDMKKPEHEK